MRVLKFGGTSVADANAIARVVSIVGGRRGPRTVVVSALAGVTDALLGVAHLAAKDAAAATLELGTLVQRHRGVAADVRGTSARRALEASIDEIALAAAETVKAIAAAGHASPALVDKLLANGELWSSRIVAAFMADGGIPAEWIDAGHVVRTNGRHRNAAPDLPATEEAVNRLIRPALAVERVVVLAGFIGSSADGATTTLGRGGSDYSAALIGACLRADEIEIWTDVDGVLSADPRIVANARVLRTLSYEDAQTLATFGAKVLHPKTIGPAAARGIPVLVLNSRRPEEPGTRIDASGAGDGRSAAVASRGGVSLVEIVARRKTADGSFAARALQSLADANVSIVVGQAFADRLTVAVDQSFDLGAFRLRVGAFADVRMRGGLAAVCAVGDRVASEPRLVTGAFAVLDDVPIHLVLRPRGPRGSTAFAVIVDDRDAHRLVTHLHDRFSADAAKAREEVLP